MQIGKGNPLNKGEPFNYKENVKMCAQIHTPTPTYANYLELDSTLIQMQGLVQLTIHHCELGVTHMTPRSLSFYCIINNIFLSSKYIRCEIGKQF